MRKIFMLLILVAIILPTNIVAGATNSTNQSEIISIKDSKKINELLDKRAKMLLKKNYEKLTEVDVDSVNKFDDAVIFINEMEEVEHLTLKNIDITFEPISAKENNDTTIVTGNLIQRFTWNEIDAESSFVDQVDVTLSDKEAKFNNLRKWKEDFDTVTKKMKANKEQQLLNSTGTKESKQEVNMLASSYTYNREVAKDYALQYAENRNTAYPSWDEDCTNFVSQALSQGGIQMYRDLTAGAYSPSWYLLKNGTTQEYMWSISWIQANELFKVLRTTSTIDTTIKSSAYDLVVGDVIQYDRTINTGINHTAIVTARYDTVSPYPIGLQKICLVSYHSTNRKNVSWDYYSTAYTSQGETVNVYFTHINDMQY